MRTVYVPGCVIVRNGFIALILEISTGAFCSDRPVTKRVDKITAQVKER